MDDMYEKQQAMNWFEENGIKSYLTGGTDIYIRVGEHDILIAQSEVSYRADLQKGKYNEH